MNICVLSSESNSYSETFIRAHVERLPGKVAFLYGGFFPTRLADGKFLVPVPGFLERGRQALLSRLLKFNYSASAMAHKAFRQYLIDQKIEVVLAEYGPVGVNVMDICKETGVHLVVHFHGFDAYRADTLKDFGPRYPELFKIASGIVVVSRHMEQHIIGMGAPKHKVHYNPCGMDKDIFFGADPAKAPAVFVAAGRFTDKKGPHITLLAFSRLLQQAPEAKLIMVGNGNLLDACKSMAKALRIEASVEFSGPQSSAQLAQMMRGARAFVQHSLVPGSGDSEGTPVVVQEAGGAGLPVISTFHAGIPDVVIDGETGFLVKECDAVAMADRMLRLVKDPELASRMGQAARQRILGQFTLDHSIANLAKIIETSVKQGKST